MTGQTVARPRVSLKTAEMVLWFFGDQNLGIAPGGFWSVMLRAFDAAYLANQERLRLASPDDAAAFL